MMTQEHYGRTGQKYVDYDAVQTCFQRLRRIMKEGDSVAIPKIGAGLGGGDWKIIEKIIEEEMEGVQVTCYVLY
jgi:O-acetyl-ADP-ribose deacetylase (regulator of RNase III)